MNAVAGVDLFDQLKQDVPPSAAAPIVDILESAAFESGTEVAHRFPSGGADSYRGVLRRQLIEERIRSDLFDYEFVPHAVTYEGKPLEDEDRLASMTFLERGSSRFMITRATSYRPVGTASMVKRLLALSTFIAVPLFPDLGRDDAPEQKTLYVVRYWLDRSDSERRHLSQIDVVVPTPDGMRVYAHVADLREIASAVAAHPVPADRRIPIVRKAPAPGDAGIGDPDSQTGHSS